MKKSLITLAMLAAFGAQAQSTNANTAGSTSSSVSAPDIKSGNSNSSAGSESISVSSPNNQAQQLLYLQQNTLTPAAQQIKQDVHYSGNQTVKNVPGIAMSGPASGPCTGMSGGVGVAGPGFGVGLNASKVDDGCTVRENTRTLGQVYQALEGGDPAKSEARKAMLEGMEALRAMNAKIAADYVPPKPVVAPTSGVVRTVEATSPTPTDPYVRRRLGLPALK